MTQGINMKPDFDRRLLENGFTRNTKVWMRDDKVVIKELTYRKEIERETLFTVTVRNNGRFGCTRYFADIDEEYPDEWDGCYLLLREAGKHFDTGVSAERVVEFLTQEGAIK